MGRNRYSLGARVFAYAMSFALVTGLIPAPAIAEMVEETSTIRVEAGSAGAGIDPVDGGDGANGIVEENDADPADQAIVEGDGTEKPAIVAEGDADGRDDGSSTIESGQEDASKEAPIEGVPDDAIRLQAQDTTSVSYIYRVWNSENKELKTLESSEIATPVPANGGMTEGWYYLDSDVSVNDRIYLTGDTNLILCDGHTLKVKGIYVPNNSTLTIYSQSDSNQGKLVSEPSGGAAIGGYSEHDNGNIIIHGGDITATGASHCAGIGSNDGCAGGAITIYGGTVTAKGGSDGAGIGGGRNCDGGAITIYGGTITANEDPNENGAGIGGGDCGKGGNITINGGTITTYSRDGAGIGGGDDGDGGTITITGGNITCRDAGDAQGARIGCGCDGEDATINISGGVIYTYNRDGAGIGGGEGTKNGCKITISGGEIHASYAEGSDGNGAAIGGGNHSGGGGTITITDGAVYASSYHGAGIGGGRAASPDFFDWGGPNSGAGGTITITGGTVEATSLEGYGIGAGGDNGYGGDDFSYTSGSLADYIGSAGTITIGGTAHVTARGCPAGIGGDSGSITIKDSCTVEASGDQNDKEGYAINLLDDEAVFTVSGGTVTLRQGAITDPALRLRDSQFRYTGGVITSISQGGFFRWVNDHTTKIDIVDTARVVVGDSAGTATAVPAKKRWDIYSNKDYAYSKYLHISICDHPDADVTGACPDCGHMSNIVKYVERSWDGTKVTETEKYSPEGIWAYPDYTSDLPAGWYYLSKSIKKSDRISLEGDTQLILGDGYTLDVKGIYIPKGHTLTIYAQSDGENAGKIYSHPSGGAAIGGYSGHDNGDIVIHGGDVTAEGADHCAGIGSNDGREGGAITIYGGTINAKGGSDGAAIGGGRYCDGGAITIYGGDVTANGPTDSDTCENGAGVGGGYKGAGGAISIWGGTVTAYSRDGAGVGGGDEGDGGDIAIHGGEVTSTKVNQGQGARVGGGCDAAPGTVAISGGTVTAVGGSGAGIGGGKRNKAGGTVTVSGGVVNASGDYGIGKGEEGSDVAVTLGWTDETFGSTRVTASSYSGTVRLERGFRDRATGEAFPAAGSVADPGALAGRELVPLATEPTFVSQNLTLGGQVGLNVYLLLPEGEGLDYAGAYVEFSVSGRRHRTVRAPVDESNRGGADGPYYGFTLPLSSIEMAQPVDATFHYSRDGEAAELSKPGISIKGYVEAFEADAEGNPDRYDDETVALVRAVADYGHWVQPFLSQANGWATGDGDDRYAEMTTHYAESYDAASVAGALAGYGMSRDLGASSVTKATASLSLVSETALDVTLTVAEGTTPSGVVATVGGEAVDAGEPVRLGKAKDGGVRWRVRVAGIRAWRLGDEVAVAGDAGGGFSVTASGLAYARAVLASGDFAENGGHDAMCALAAFHDAEMAYRAKHPQA